MSYAQATGKQNTLKKLSQPPPEKLINWAQRLLTPATDNTAYSFVYMGSPRHTMHSEIHKALRLVGIATERVIDIQFPAHGIVGLLIHSSYEKELRELLSLAKLTSKDNINPISANAIGDPTLLAKLTEIERANEAKKLYQERMLAMCTHLSKKHLGMAIMRHFTSLQKEDIHHISNDYWHKFQESNPKPTIRREHQDMTTTETRKQLSSDNDSSHDNTKPMEE